ncbi:MAG: carboxypeptidase regulatory-like domain-containing protein, partial [Verrucomicrobiota bacterium]
MYPRCPTFTASKLRLGLLVLIALSLGGLLRAATAEATKRPFRLDSGDAATTLRQFAAQAGEQVLFPPEAVRGVMTKSVRGEYTPREALVMMTSGTTLVVMQDEKSGALSVKRDGPAEKNAEGRPANDRAALSPASAGPMASGATGDVTGRIKNMATGAYLNNARVAVSGTRLLVFTDDTGTFRINGVPSGAVSLAIFYTGLDPQVVNVQVEPGQTTERNIELTSASRYGGGTGVIELDSFVVASARETDIEAIAINEQRFAPNIKNVVSTETLGDPLGGSMGDFLRFLPGVAASYGALETEGVLIRGFPSGMSIVSVDGVQMAGANLSGERDFTPSRMGVNSISRVEVTKVPLPSTPADTMSGSINLVSKSAFERSKAEFKYRVGVSSNEQTFAVKKTPSALNKNTYKVFPDFSFDYTLPINKQLGIVVTGLHSTSSFQTDTWYTDYLAGGTSTGATPANPYLQRNRNVEIFRSYERSSLSLKVDWRPSKHGVLSLGGMVLRYHQENPNSQFNPT